MKTSNWDEWKIMTLNPHKKKKKSPSHMQSTASILICPYVSHVNIFHQILNNMDYFDKRPKG